MYFDGRFSHAARKGPMLPRRRRARACDGDALYVEEDMSAREPSAAETRGRRRGDRRSCPSGSGRLLYARIDLLPGPDGPVVVEVEVTEPSLFLRSPPGAVAGRPIRTLAIAEHGHERADGCTRALPSVAAEPDCARCGG